MKSYCEYCGSIISNGERCEACGAPIKGKNIVVLTSLSKIKRGLKRGQHKRDTVDPLEESGDDN